jgi:hypothetical protein
MLRHAPADQLRVLVENYRTATDRAHVARKKQHRIELDGRYHLDGVPPPVRDHHHDEHRAALELADSIMRWVDDGGRVSNC